jgi:AICAR transformylase/IMP cyclohydrolase PurH
VDNQWHAKVSVLGIKLKNQLAQEDMPLVRSVVKFVKSFSIGWVSGAHAVGIDSEQHQEISSTRIGYGSKK